MATRAKKSGRVPPRELVPVGINSGPGALKLQALDVPLTSLEERFAQLYVAYNNATRAYIEASEHVGNRQSARAYGWQLVNRPHVLARIRQYQSAAAAACVIDYAAILDHDRQVVEGFMHADQITQHIWVCCRYCYGQGNKYQWIDFEEYLAALTRQTEDNDERRARKLDAKPLPSDEGGFGYDSSAEPNIRCPKCEGRGTSVTVIADTTKLEGPARAIVKGLKVTQNGIEVLMHDVDKAKERLLRAGGYFKDDAASVARGAAAGAAAGATAAIAAARAAEQAQEMTVEEAQRRYLELA